LPVVKKINLKRLAIVTTHPIQYYAPWFKMLKERGKVQPKVFYTWGEAVLQKKYDPGFNKTIEWDIPLLNGYEYSFPGNIAAEPGSHHFAGINNPGLINEIEQWRPDAILVIGWSFKSHLKLLRHFKGKRQLLFRGDSTLLDEPAGFSFKKIARRILLKWIYHHVDKALYVGTANKAYYLANGLREAQLIFAPHAVDNNRFGEGRKTSKKEVDEHAPGTITFLFAGKFEHKKAPCLLLDAFLQIADTKAHLLLVGDGALEEQLKTLVSGQPDSVRHRIRFLPFQNQGRMPAVYAMADVLVLPSNGPGETWGLSVNEAMACGKAILVSDKCGCAADLVKDADNGYTFKSGNTGDLVNKMKLLLANAEKPAIMGTRSLEIIKDWRFEKICVAVEQCLK